MTTIYQQAASAAATVVPVPGFSPSAASFNFGNVLLTTAATPQSLIITNTGAANLNDWRHIDRRQPVGLQRQRHALSHAHSAFDDVCGPTGFILGQGVRNALLNIASDAAGSPHVINLTGTGIPPTANVRAGCR